MFLSGSGLVISILLLSSDASLVHASLAFFRAGLRPALFLLTLGSVSVDLSGHDQTQDNAPTSPQTPNQVLTKKELAAGLL